MAVQTKILDDEKSIDMMKSFITTVGVFQKMNGCSDDEIVGLLLVTICQVHFSHGLDEKVLKENLSELIDGHYQDYLAHIKTRSN